MGDRTPSVSLQFPIFVLILLKGLLCIGLTFLWFFGDENTVFDLLEQRLHYKTKNGKGFMKWGRKTNLKLDTLNLNLSEVSNIYFFTKAEER